MLFIVRYAPPNLTHIVLLHNNVSPCDQGPIDFGTSGSKVKITEAEHVN